MRPLLLVALLTSVPAVAADRTVGVGSFDRVRVTGAFAVRIATGRPPRAQLSGDPRALDLVDLRVDGTTLTLRRRSDPASVRLTSDAVTVTLSGQTLVAASVIGPASIVVTGMKTGRADLSVAGSGTIAVERLAAEQANATVVGGGRITLAGRATHARLLINGPGGIDASGLAADDLLVRLDGPGDVGAQARYVADVTTTGMGRVIVAGKPKCTVRAPTGGAVSCGAP